MAGLVTACLMLSELNCTLVQALSQAQALSLH